MFTVCPKCALTLVVTAQDLRVAQGYVRCGRCSNVFNAIVGLTDDRGDARRAHDLTGEFGQRLHRGDHVDDLKPGLVTGPDGLLSGNQYHRHRTEMGVGSAGGEV